MIEIASRRARVFDRERLAKVADGCAVGLAATLPWSTSATEIFAALLAIAILATLDRASLRRVLTTPAGGLPVLLCVLAAIGMLWAFGATLAERWDGLSSFLKLLAIPLLMVQFSRSERGSHVMIGFMGSCVVLLALSWAIVFIPPLAARWPIRGTFGVPVRDYIAQSGEFTVCIFVLAKLAHEDWRAGLSRRAIAGLALAALFFINILYVSTSRTVLVVFPILLLLFAFKHLSRKGALGVLVAALVVAAAAWSLAPLVRGNITNLIGEVRDYRPDGADSRAGARIEFWRKSVGFVTSAPLIGNGTGSIRELFRRAAAGQSGLAGVASVNPHNQTLTVAVQLGLLGTAVLFAMWLSHLLLFRGPGLAAWAGLVITTQNVVGSLFSSHLFDVTQGWGYVLGVGVAAGMVLKAAATPRP